MTDYSVNERAEKIMGRRLTPEQEANGAMAFDMPTELGYRCPVCLPADPAMDLDGLEWSEYAGFLWCETCDKDYPSALCIDHSDKPDPRRPWRNAGIDAAISVFLDSVESAIRRAYSPETCKENRA